MVGGIGSGALRSTCTGDVEDALALDIRALRRLGLVRVGECVIDTICWSIDGLGTFSARLRIDMSDAKRGGTIVVAGTMPDHRTINHRIAIETIPSSFGGWRCYLICPVTARRCEIVYYGEGRFASREACRLSYRVQNTGDLSRARRRAAKLRARLRGSAGFARVRGAHRADIAERLRHAEQEVTEQYIERLRASLDRSAARRIPDDNS